MESVTASAVSLSEELSEVETELTSVQAQLDTLLEKQEQLLERKNELKARLHSLESSAVQENTSVNWEEGVFPWSSNIQATLKSIFKIEKLRPLQASCINATMSNKDTILIMPTGGGKSLCYQLPAVLTPGLTLVVSPLVSLIEDQLLASNNLGIQSCGLNSSSSREDVSRIHATMIQKDSSLKLLFVTPEKIAKGKRFMSKLEKSYEVGRLSRIVIDEVHCTSQWGHDFRPDYKILGILKRQFPSVPILGLTATATFKVLEDVKEMLSLKECLVFRASYNRSNLFYEVRLKKSVYKDHLDVMSSLIKRKFLSKSGIVYCFSRKETEDVASSLCQQGIKAACYHSELPLKQRSKVHMKWLDNSIQVIIATIAFGMGIDKPDVRFIIHHSISKSMENYYQESGRAGRDGHPAHCITFFRAADVFRQSTMVFTEHTGLQNLYAMLRYCLNKAECRRAIIARSFGEKWKESDCNMSCDVCTLYPQTKSRDAGESIRFRNTECSSHDSMSGTNKRDLTYITVKKDITESCKTLVDIIENEQAMDKKVTALKVVALWRERLKRSNQSSSFSVEDCEHMLLQAVVDGVLKEEFHFTPYNTISYMGLGRKAETVKRGVVKIMVAIRVVGNNDPDNILTDEDITRGKSQAIKSVQKKTATVQRIKKSPAFLPPMLTSNKDRNMHEHAIKMENAEKCSIKRKLPEMLLSSGLVHSDLLSLDDKLSANKKLKNSSGMQGSGSNTSSLCDLEANAVIEIDSD